MLDNLLTTKLVEMAGKNVLSGQDKDKEALIKCCNYLATQFEIAAKQGRYQNDVLTIAAGFFSKQDA